MSAGSLSLDWLGPFTLDEAISSPHSEKAGIYIFTCEYLGSDLKIISRPAFLIRWPGYTQTSYKQRLKKWRSEHKAGQWFVLDSNDMQNGKHTVLWGSKSIHLTPQEKIEFKVWLQENEQALDKMLSAFRIFFAPLEVDKRTLQRIEAAIMDILYDQTGPVRTILDEGMHRSARKANEAPFQVSSRSVGLLGLPDNFSA